MLPKVKKADMAGMMEAIEEYLQLCYCVMREPLSYVVRKTIIVQTYGDYHKYVTPDDEMISRMLHLPPDRNRLHSKQSAQSINKHMAEYKIDNKSIYDILDQICKDTDLNLYFKQHQSMRDDKGEFYAIHSRPKSYEHDSLRS